MLTKDEILRKMAGFDCPSYLHESCWQPIYDQCVAAIDLAAENKLLRAKLDAVRGRCKRTPMSAVAIEVLEILDKDGDGE